MKQWRAGERGRDGERRRHWWKRQWQMQEERKKSCTMHTYITCTSRIDFAVPLRLIRCRGNVNQNGNENLCNSNWIYTDEGHFIGKEAGPNSQNEDWFCNSFSPFSLSLSRTDTHTHFYCIPWNTQVVFGIQTKNEERLRKTTSCIMRRVLLLYE